MDLAELTGKVALVTGAGSGAAIHITGTEVWIDGGSSLIQG